MTISLSSQLVEQVYELSYSVGDLSVCFHLRSPYSSVSVYRIPAIDLLSDVLTLRFNLINHCQTPECNFSADLAQNLFSMLATAESSLERIK